MICGQCGDILMKKPLVSSKRIFGILGASAFLVPLLIMIIFVIKDLTNERHPSNSESLVQLILGQ